MSLGYLSIQTR
ncbi:hypothetical protein F383_38763 [Gossypium arboreum]|uniref:Uncharacterized protein n=1 Tax=Gossypium arboreum TaxID=29729 RepID=A0A0B0MKY3_GOSAR|nr:hypothetical protein F383_38763 [Gossypium arboreum]